MVFADLFFIYCFLPVCIICYLCAKKLKAKNIVLCVFSVLLCMGRADMGFASHIQFGV